MSSVYAEEGGQLSRIVIAMFPEGGHLYGSFGLSSKLQRNGHEVIYLGDPESEELITSKGFEYHPIFEEINSSRKNTAKTAPHDRLTLQHQKERNHKFIEILFSDNLDKKLQQIQPDLVVVDSFLPFLALISYRNKINSIFVSVTLQERDISVPLLTSKTIPKPNSISHKKIRYAWKTKLAKYAIRKTLLKLLGIDVDFSKLLFDLAKTTGYSN